MERCQQALRGLSRQNLNHPHRHHCGFAYEHRHAPHCPIQVRPQFQEISLALLFVSAFTICVALRALILFFYFQGYQRHN